MQRCRRTGSEFHEPRIPDRPLQNHLKARPVVWISGVRRVGKTCLAQSLEKTEYFDCELPRVRRAMEDPEAFLEGLQRRRVVLDEIHRLGNPAELLKIAADHFPKIKVLATGSFTLGASSKFRDKLAGRKAELWPTPMVQEDLDRLWEHFVLNEIQARTQSRAIHYWRDKRGHEVDFI